MNKTNGKEVVGEYMACLVYSLLSLVSPTIRVLGVSSLMVERNTDIIGLSGYTGPAAQSLLHLRLRAGAASKISVAADGRETCAGTSSEVMIGNSETAIRSTMAHIGGGAIAAASGMEGRGV